VKLGVYFTGCIALQRALNKFTVLNIIKNLASFCQLYQKIYLLMDFKVFLLSFCHLIKFQPITRWLSDEENFVILSL